MGIVAEFVGPPGSGKTTLVRALADRRLPGGGRVVPGLDLVRVPRPVLPRRLGRRFARPADPAARRRAASAYALEWAGFLEHMLAGPGPATGPIGRINGLVWTMTTLETLAVARMRVGRDAVLMDEGPLQRILAVADGGADRELIRRHASLAPATDLVLHLVIPSEVVLERIMRRGKLRMNDRHLGLGPTGLQEAIARDAELLDGVVASAEAIGRQVVRVEAVGASADLIATCWRAIARQISAA